MIEVGSKVPDMTLLDDQGNEVKLANLVGSPFVLYVYPADDTPGCTKQACSFRDNFETYKKAGVAVYGVSPDSVASHVKFRDKYNLPFRLLADTDHQLAEALGAWGERNLYGKKSTGILRTTVVFGADGTVQHIYPKVKPEENATQILNDLGISQS